MLNAWTCFTVLLENADRYQTREQLLAALEDTLAISEFARRVADLANPRTIEEAHGLDELMDRVAARPDGGSV